MSGSPKITNRLPLPVFLRSSAMCRSAFIRALSTGMRPSLLELGRVGVVVEGAGDEHVEAGVAGLARGRHQVGPWHGAELGTDEDRGALLDRPRALDVAPLGADEPARPRGQGREDDLVLLVRLLHAGGLEVLQDHLERSPARSRRRGRLGSPSISSSSSVDARARGGATGSPP